MGYLTLQLLGQQSPVVCLFTLCHFVLPVLKPILIIPAQPIKSLSKSPVSIASVGFNDFISDLVNSSSESLFWRLRPPL